MNKEHIDLKHLLAVKAIFKTNHLTKAAELLCLSQPALSRRISTLEHKLGLNIFNRVGKKLIPTTAGKKLIELADQVLPIYQHTQNDLQLLKQGHNEPIRIATACFTCYHWLPDVIKQLKDGIQIDIVSEATENPNQALIDGLIDISIATQVCEHPDVISSKLSSDQYLAVVSKNHPLADASYLTPADCTTEHLILYSKNSQAYDLFLKPQNIIPKRLSAVPLTGAILQMVKANLGISFQSQWVLSGRNLSQDYQTLRLGQNGIKRKWFVSYLQSNQNTQLNSIIAAFKSTISSHNS